MAINFAFNCDFIFDNKLKLYNNTNITTTKNLRAIIRPPIIRYVYLYKESKRRFCQRQLQVQSKHMLSACIHMLVFCFNQYAIHWHCSGQSENWNWHKNLCFYYNVSTRDVLHITPRKIKQHQRILPIHCIDLLCENVQHA